MNRPAVVEKIREHIAKPNSVFLKLSNQGQRGELERLGIEASEAEIQEALTPPVAAPLSTPIHQPSREEQERMASWATAQKKQREQTGSSDVVEAPKPLPKYEDPEESLNARIAAIVAEEPSLNTCTHLKFTKRLAERGLTVSVPEAIKFWKTHKQVEKSIDSSATPAAEQTRVIEFVDGKPIVPMQAPPVDDGRVGDFIWSYADYADVLEVPRILHELVAIQLVATALNCSGVTIPFGELQLPLDIWILLLSGSGGGRSTLVRLFKKILKRANMTDLQSSVRWGSGQAVFQHFAEKPCGLHVWGEMSEQLAMLNTSLFASVKQWITDRYDDLEVPPSHRFKINGKGEDTKPIVFPAAPRINILATSSNDWFFKNLEETDSLGGFMPRWMIYQVDANGRDVAIPPPTDISAIEPLAGRLAAIGRLSGQADIADIEEPYRGWYSATKRRFEAQPNKALAMVYFNRHRVNILKLAVVFEASRSASLKVSPEASQRAVEFAGEVEKCIFRLLQTGMSATGYAFSRIEEYIRSTGTKGVCFTDLRRAFQGDERFRKQRAEEIEMLISEDKIVTRPLLGKGRPKQFYVHKDFCQVKS